MPVSTRYSSVSFANVGSIAATCLLSAYNDIDLFLAPLALRSQCYASHCVKRSQSVFTIMDSGALETLAGTDNSDIKPSDLLELSIELGIHEVVCSDCPGDPRGSLLRTREFLKLHRQCAECIRPHLMVVPHGRSLDEWFRNAEKLISEAGHCTVGIPRLLSKQCDPDNPSFRINIAETISRNYPGVTSHLLGAGENFLMELSQLYPGVPIRSIDSTFIYRYACTGANPKSRYIAPLPLCSDVLPTHFCNNLEGVIFNLRQYLNGAWSNE